MLIIFVIFSVYSFFIVSRFYRVKKHYEHNGKLFGHGVKTWRNSFNLDLQHAILLLAFSTFGPYLNTIKDYIIHPEFITWPLIFLISFSIVHYAYDFSEIKHLSDGINKEQNNEKEFRFFIISFMGTGIFGIICNIVFSRIVHLTSFNYLFIILLFIIGFASGMGDLMQNRGINKSSKEDILYSFIDIPSQLFKAIFNKKDRANFISILNYNMLNIYRGIKMVTQIKS